MIYLEIFIFTMLFIIGFKDDIHYKLSFLPLKTINISRENILPIIKFEFKNIFNKHFQSFYLIFLINLCQINTIL